MSSNYLLAWTQHFDNAAGRHLRTLGNLIATNSEVRKILSDFSVIGRDILARTASHAAETVRPDQDALTNIDRPAPSDQFETAGGSNGPPVVELDVPGSDTVVRHHPLKGAEVEHEGQVRSASQAAGEVRERARAEAKDTVEYVFVTDFLSSRFNLLNRAATDGDTDAGAKKSGLAGRLQNFKASVGAV